MKSDIQAIGNDTSSEDHRIPVTVDLREGIYFRHLDLGPTEWDSHTHVWGQWNYLSHGVMNLIIAGRTVLSPPQYAVWIPPGLPHAAVNSAPATYRTVYLSEEVSRKLPATPCALTVSEVLRAILAEFSRLDVRVPRTPQEKNMAMVVLDQIQASLPVDDYMPAPASALLALVAEEITRDLSVKRSTRWLAAHCHLTERTLERRCKGEIGISIGAWQQRLRFMHALTLLDGGHSVKQAGLELGYASPSVFISMFKRIAGQTPDQYRRAKR
jgi:AraC-like DNA-binding protein